MTYRVANREKLVHFGIPIVDSGPYHDSLEATMEGWARTIADAPILFATRPTNKVVGAMPYPELSDKPSIGWSLSTALAQHPINGEIQVRGIVDAQLAPRHVMLVLPVFRYRTDAERPLSSAAYEWAARQREQSGLVLPDHIGYPSTLVWGHRLDDEFVVETLQGMTITGRLPEGVDPVEGVRPLSDALAQIVGAARYWVLHEKGALYLERPS